MDMCYDGALVLPSSYAVMNENEMNYVEGGIAVSTVVGIVTAVIATYGATYGAGTVCGKRLYYAGMNTTQKWSKWKWQTRAIVIGTASSLGLDGGMNMKTNLELILLVINWVIVAIQAFTIFLYGNSIGLFIIMLLALIVQVFSVYDNKKK